jgi:hypothetical protein
MDSVMEFSWVADGKIAVQRMGYQMRPAEQHARGKTHLCETAPSFDGPGAISMQEPGGRNMNIAGRGSASHEEHRAKAI